MWCFTVSEAVSVSIGGKRFDAWSSVQITRAIDSIDTVELSRPFDHSDKSQRETFRPISYQSCVVSVSGETVVTGPLVPVVPESTSESAMVSMGIYSKPGVLSECQPYQQSYPLKMNGLNLKDITERLIEPFEIRAKFKAPPGEVFKKIEISDGTPILQTLAELAQSRGLLITSSNIGDLVFQSAVSDGTTVAVLQDGFPPVLGVRPSISPREFYSEITGTKPIRPKSKKTEIFTVQLPYIGNTFRPFIFDAKNSLDGDIKTAVNAKASRMIGNAISYDVEVATWRDENGRLWKPNTLVQLSAPGSMIYSSYVFLIRSVVLTQNSDSETASLQITVPGAFAPGVKLGRLPWEE